MEMKELARQNFDEAAAIVKEVTQETKLLYSEFFGEPGSHKAHELLHTHYTERSKF